MDKLLLTPTEAAHALGIGRSKLYELLHVGALDSVLIGSCRRIPTDALGRYIERLQAASQQADELDGTRRHLAHEGRPLPAPRTLGPEQSHPVTTRCVRVI
jgi:excisionase family DNA binding protein